MIRFLLGSLTRNSSATTLGVSSHMTGVSQEAGMQNALRRVLQWLSGEPNIEVSPTLPAESTLDLFPEAKKKQRSTERQALSIPATLATGSFAVPDPIAVRDLSSRGLYFYVAFRLPVGQLIQIIMTAPDTNERVRY